MDLKLIRMPADDDSTVGILFINKEPECFTLEDEYREVKVPGETRIDNGRYLIKLKESGRMHAEYAKKFPWHKGMLELQNVPNFKYIYIHIGNTDADSSGCILTGTSATYSKHLNSKLINSTQAYERMYKQIIEAMDKGEQVFITIQELVL